MQSELELLTSNGDYGTINMAIFHGASVISTGLTEDKEEVSAHVQCSGAGIELRANKAIPEAIKHTLDEIFTQPAYCERAAALARVRQPQCRSRTA
jgi:UDP:flavonoid glycosyltransferase YjiC (YdhE family)